MKIALAQLSYTAGDIDGNCAKIIEAIGRAKNAGAELVVFSELAVSGYCPPAQLLNSQLVERCKMGIERIATHCNGIAAAVGAPWLNSDGALHSSAYMLSNGSVQCVNHQPTIDLRTSKHSSPAHTIVGSTHIEIATGANIWESPLPSPSGIAVRIAALPFAHDTEQQHIMALRRNVAKSGLSTIFVNMVGGNTGTIFAGGSMVLNAKGEILNILKSFDEDFATIDTDDLNRSPIEIENGDPARIARIHDALVMSIGNYFRKAGLDKAAVGLSGGLDSAVVLALLHRALGSQNIRVLLMPSQYSSKHSIDDAVALANALHVRYDIVSIQPIFEAYKNTLSDIFAGLPEDVTEENLQARVRGGLLMALSNKFGHLILNTTNKSELAMGYGTLYGDMNGAFSVLGDVYKTDVYKLAHHINRSSEIIPSSTITKPPSAELRPDQKDTDSLPPYNILDRILYCYIEQQLKPEQIIAQGFDAEIVNRAVRLVNGSRYKRLQAPPVVGVSSRTLATL